MKTLGIPPLIARNTLLFALAQALSGSAVQLVPTLGAPMVERLLGSASLAGIGFSVIALSRVLMAYPFGKLADTLGRKPGLVLGFGVGVIGAGLLAYSIAASSFLAFLVGMLLFGAGFAANQQIRVAAADMYPPVRRAEGLGFVLTGSVLGAFGGALLVGAADASSGFFRLEPLALSWALLPLVLLPSALLVLLVRPDPKAIASNLGSFYPGYRPAGEAEVGATDQASFLTLLRDRRKLAVFVTSGAAQGQMAMLMALNSLMLSHHGYSLTAISAAVTAHVIGMFGLSIPLGRLADRVGHRPLLMAGLGISAAGAVLLPTTTSYVVVTLAIMLVGLGWSCVNVAGTALLADLSTPEERGRTIGANDTLAAIAGAVFPLLGGFVVAYWGFPYLGALGAIMMLAPVYFLSKTSVAPRPAMEAVESS